MLCSFGRQFKEAVCFDVKTNICCSVAVQGQRQNGWPNWSLCIWYSGNKVCALQLRIAAPLTQHPRPDNNWVVKLAQGSRSTDLCLSDSEALIVNLRRAPGGDRVVQKYISRPVLFKGHKFDLRVLPCFPLFLPLTSNRRSSAVTAEASACSHWNCLLVQHGLHCCSLEAAETKVFAQCPTQCAAHVEKLVLVQAWDQIAEGQHERIC